MPESFLDVKWDGAEVGRLLQKKALRYNTDISGLMVKELGQMANTAAKVLPPFNGSQNFSKPSYVRQKPVGERRVNQGYDLTYPDAKGGDRRSSAGSYVAPGAYRGIVKVAGENVARSFYAIFYQRGEKAALDFLREKGVPVSFPVKGRHDAARLRRKQGHPGRSDFIAVSPTRGRISRIKGSKDRVGRLKAAYSVSASELGTKGIPKWVSRHHSRREGKVDKTQLFRPWRQSISAIPYAQYAPSGSTTLVDKALSIRQKNLKNEVNYAERRATRYFNRR